MQLWLYISPCAQVATPTTFSAGPAISVETGDLSERRVVADRRFAARQRLRQRQRQRQPRAATVPPVVPVNELPGPRPDSIWCRVAAVGSEMAFREKAEEKAAAEKAAAVKAANEKGAARAADARAIMEKQTTAAIQNAAAFTAKVEKEKEKAAALSAAWDRVLGERTSRSVSRKKRRPPLSAA